MEALAENTNPLLLCLEHDGTFINFFSRANVVPEAVQELSAVGLF
jgi:hypothetical protein